MSQTDTLTGRRLTISDLGRAPRARQAAATATPKPAPSKAAVTPTPSSKPAKAKAVQQKQPKSPEQMAKAAANIERDRQQHYEAIGRRAVARDANFAELRTRFSVVFDPDRPLPLALRVHHQLRAALGAPRSQVIDLLEWWTAQPSYIAAIAAGGMRWNLDGSEAGEISDEHRAHAEKQLKATR
jgi:hypothetical protein